MRLGVSCAQSSVLDDGTRPGIARLRDFEQNLDFMVHVEKSTSMLDLETMLFCRKQTSGPRQTVNLRSPREKTRKSGSGVEVEFSTWTIKSRFCSKSRSRAIPVRIPSSITLDCAQDTPSLMQIRRLRPENERFYGFMVHSYFMVSRLRRCNLLYESFPAETLSCRSAAGLK